MAVRVRDRRPTRPGRRGGGSSIMAAIRSRRGQKTQLRRRRRRHRRRRRRRRRRASWNRVESVASVFMVFFFLSPKNAITVVTVCAADVATSSNRVERPDGPTNSIYRFTEYSASRSRFNATLFDIGSFSVIIFIDNCSIWSIPVCCT